MTTILAPIDFSDATKPVVATAAALSRALGSRLVLLNVTAPPLILADDMAAAQLIVSLTKIATATATRKLSNWQRKLQADGITTLTRHRSGGITAEVIAEAKQLKADYIVLGSHGHSAVFELLAGSTASGILKKADCNVVVVPIRPRRKK